MNITKNNVKIALNTHVHILSLSIVSPEKVLIRLTITIINDSIDTAVNITTCVQIITLFITNIKTGEFILVSANTKQDIWGFRYFLPFFNSNFLYISNR